MAESADWIFQVGVNTTEASSQIDAFVNKTKIALNSLKNINLSVANTLGDQNKILAAVQQRLSVEQKAADVQNKASASEAKLQAQLAQATSQRLRAEEQIAALQARSNSSSGNHLGGSSGSAFKDISGIANANAAGVKRQADAFDMLNRIAGNTVFKFVEYEIIMQAFNKTISEFINSLNEASNVQMEQVLQRIYSGTINTNQALKDAIIIAKQWGSDITDVQQAIGLWTKQTSQMRDETGKLVDSQTALAAAAKLAADAEKFHAASGIESMEVYRMSVSIWHELGLTLGQIPDLYDKIAFAATKISPVLKAQPGSTSKQEGIKDIFEGLAESGAALKAQGLGPEGIIAVVATQVENLGESGRKAGASISAMFGALNQGGNPLREWVGLLGSGAFKDQNTFLAAAVQNVEKIKQASADGLLKVSKNQINTFREFVGTLDEVKRLTQEIHDKSRGTLDFIANAQMDTYTGQVKRLGAAFQEFNLSLGTQALPNATRFVEYLTGTAMPALSQHTSQIYGLATMLAQLGVAYLAKVGLIDRFGLAVRNSTAAVQAEMQAEAAAETTVTSYTAAKDRAAASAQIFVQAELNSADAIAKAQVQMEREQAALQLLQEKLQVVQWQTEGFAKACSDLGVTMAEVGDIAGTRAVSGIAAFGSAVGGMVSKLLASAGPLFALYAVMSAMGNFDKLGRMNRSIDDAAHEKESGVKGFTDSFGDVLKAPLVVGDGGGASAMLQRARRRKGKDAQFGKDVNNDIYAYEHAKSNDQITDAAEQLKRDLFAEDQLEHPLRQPGYDKLDNIPPWLKKLMDRSSGGSPAGMVLPNPKPGSAKGMASQQQAFAEQVNAEKRSAMSDLTAARDREKAAQTDIATEHLLIKTFGLTKETLAQLSSSYKAQDKALSDSEVATRKEIAALQQKVAIGRQLASTHPAGSKAWYAEEKAISMAEAAIRKAQGALVVYHAQRAKLKVEAEADMAALRSQIHLQEIGAVSNPMHTQFGPISRDALPVVKSFNEELTRLKKGFTDAKDPNTALNMALYEQRETMRIGKQLYAEYIALQERQAHGLPVNAQYMAQVRTALIAYSDANVEAGNNVDSARQKVQDMTTAVRDLSETISGKNLDDLASILHLDKADADAAKELWQGYKNIGDEIDKLNKLEASYKGHMTQSQRDAINNTRQEIALQYQLVGLVADEKRIRESTTYKAVNSALDSFGTSQIDAMVNRIFGSKNSGFGQLFADITKQVMDAWWKETTSKMMDALFPSSEKQREEELKAAYKAHVEGQMNAANIMQQVVQQMLESAHIYQSAAGTISGNGNGSSSNPTNPLNVIAGFLGGKSSYRPGPNMGADGGATPQDQAAATADAIHADDNTVSGKATADATRETNKYLSGGKFVTDLQSVLLPLLAMMGATGGSGTTGLIAAGAGMFLNSSLGQKWLNGKDGGAAQAAGYGMQGIEYGNAFGQMMGGGSHTAWGEAGGAAGGVIGTIIGGPVGGAIGSALGAAIGSLFGHADNPSQMPDKYDTQRFTTFVGELQGHAGTGYGPSYNGSTDAIQQQLGGKPMLQYIQDWIKANLNSSDAKTKALAQQLQGQYGTTGGGQLTFDTNIGQEHVVGGSLSGSYVDLHNAASDAVKSITALSNAAATAAQAPLISISAYGSGAGYGGPNPYNTPGMNKSELKALQDNKFSSLPTTSYMETSPYDAPGVAGYGGGGVRKTQPILVKPESLMPPIVVTSNVVLDGQVVAKVVNAYNAQTANRYNRAA